MTGQTQDFFHHYRAMDTRVLLARYRSGGLLPEAEAALREVLADRGCDVAAPESKGADGAATLRVDEAAAAPSLSTEEGRPLLVGWRWLKQTSMAIALQVKDGVFRRETWAYIARFGLLAACLWAAELASLFGMGLFVVANVFCDSGPQAKCFHMGLQFFKIGFVADALLIPAMIALLYPKRWIAWYLKAVPVLSLAVFVAAIHWYRLFPMLCPTAAKLSALIAFLATAHLILSRKSGMAPAPGSA